MDHELVERARSGDHDAFEVLAAGIVDHLYGVARLILRDADRAEDAAQEALVRCWRDLPSLREVDRFDAWLGRLLMHAINDEFRRGSRFRANITVLAREPSITDATSTAIADRELLERGFARLSSSIAASSSFDSISACPSRRRLHPWDPCRDGEVPAALRDRGPASSTRGRCSTAVAGGERMNAGPDVERRISSWLADEIPIRAPDRILPAAFDRTRHTQQRRFGVAWRTITMNRTWQLVTAAVVGVLLIGLGAVWLGGRAASAGRHDAITDSHAATLPDVRLCRARNVRLADPDIPGDHGHHAGRLARATGAGQERRHAPAVGLSPGSWATSTPIRASGATACPSRRARAAGRPSVDDLANALARQPLRNGTHRPRSRSTDTPGSTSS